MTAQAKMDAALAAKGGVGSEKLPDPYGWLYYGTPDRPLFCRDQLYWLCVSSAPVYSHEQMRVAAAEADALRRERDELAARLAAERERCAAIAWDHYMTTCRSLRCAPAVYDQWCAAAAIRDARHAPARQPGRGD